MELRQLQTFLAVVDGGSVGAAARALGVSQPSVTKTIRLFEVSLGAPLFDRSVAGSKPTHVAVLLEAHARAIVNAAERARSEIAELATGRLGRLTVASGPTFGETLFPAVLSRFHADHPLVEVSISTEPFAKVLAMVLAGEVDFAFTTLDQRSLDDALVREVLVPNERVIVAAGPAHPLAARRRVSPQDAWAHPWVLSRHRGTFRAILAERFARAGLPLPSAALDCASVEIQRGILRQGRHLGAIAATAVRDELAAGTLREIRVPELGWTFSAGVFYRKAAPLSPIMRHFVETARDVCREMKQRRR
jgi:DNA-binding transcriptional LysR family regulator